MRALQAAKPWGIEGLHFVDAPKPEPGPNEVLVRMRAASLNYRDLMMIEARYPRADGAEPGAITPLSDGCGVIEAIGLGVTRVAVGDRVATMFFQKWLDGKPTPEMLATSLGSPIPGVAREYAVYHEDGVSKVPAFLSDAEVATLPCAGLTAWKSLFVDAVLKPGELVVLEGTGGVSIFGLQFARAEGLKTFITSSSDEKLERAKALGADYVLNYKTHPEWSAEVVRITNGEGAPFVMEVGGANTLREALKGVSKGAHIAMIGMVGGQGAPPTPDDVAAVGAKLWRVFVGSRKMFEDMCAMIEKHRITPVVDKVFAFADAPKAFAAMKGETHFGKIVITF